MSPEINEEEGGFILHRVGTDEYEFVKVRNMHAGTAKATSLYEVDTSPGLGNEYADKVLKRTYLSRKMEWEVHASFHTHPKGCEPWPSRLDLAALFTSHRVNYIYSHDMGVLMRYDNFNKETNKWQASQVNL